MSELVLVVSDLYQAATRVPRVGLDAGLAGLMRLARFGTVEPLPDGWRAWIASLLGRADLAGASPAAIAAAAVCDASRAPQEPQPHEFVWFADPVHLIAGLTSMHLAPRGVLTLDSPTQRALRDAFGAMFAERRMRLVPTRAGRFLASGPAPEGDVRTTEPQRALGSNILEAVPSGAGAGALLSLGAEIEMWLHEHPLNAARLRARQPAISTLWLWGGGPPLVDAGRAAASTSGSSSSAAIFGDDPYMEGLARLCGARIAPQSPDLESAMAERAPRRVVALELFRAPQAPPESAGARGTPNERGMSALTDAGDPLMTFDREWVAPALERLARGELSRLTVVANDRRVSITARDRLKLWRRPRGALEALR